MLPPVSALITSQRGVNDPRGGGFKIQLLPGEKGAAASMWSHARRSRDAATVPQLHV